MPHRNRDNLGNFLPNTPTASKNQPSISFSGCELEDALSKQPEIFEEPTWGEEEGEPIPTDQMAKNRNDRGDKERVEGGFPIRETNGDAKMKNISPSDLPHFHSLTSEYPYTFLFQFAVICRTYDYTTDDQKLKLFPSTLKDVALHWFMGLHVDSFTTWS